MAAIIFGIIGALTGSVSALYAQRSYDVAAATQEEQDAQLQRTYADKVILAIYASDQRIVQNFGGLPILDVRLVLRTSAASLDQPDSNEKIVHLGSLPPCSQIDASKILLDALQGNHPEAGTKIAEFVRFTDISGKTWNRTLAGRPYEVKSNTTLQISPEAGVVVKIEPISACGQ
jgi:hypothetical protein